MGLSYDQYDHQYLQCFKRFKSELCIFNTLADLQNLVVIHIHILELHRRSGCHDISVQGSESGHERELLNLHA